MLGRVEANCDTLYSRRQSRVCAAIVTYNIGEEIHRCFDAIRHQVGHVVIVDNGSDECTQRELKKIEACENVTLIVNEHNEGVAHAYNQAVQWARGKAFQWILMLDHDSEATPGMVAKLIDAYTTLEQQGITNAGVIGANPFDVNLNHYLFYGPGEEGRPLLADEVDVISSGSLISLRVFDAVGPFNEDLFVYYVDTDFCKRLSLVGFGVYVCLNAKLLHREGTKRRRSFLWIRANYDHYGKTARYYLTRNTIYVMKKFPLTREDVYILVRRFANDHAKVLLFDEERFSILWYSLKGLIDGLRGKVGPMNSTNAMTWKNR